MSTIMEKGIEKKAGFDFSKLPTCVYTSDTLPVCRNKVSNGAATCHWHTPKLKEVIFIDPERLTVSSAIKLVNDTITEAKSATDLDEDEVRSLGAFVKIIQAGTEISFKESSLIDAQTKLNNAIKKIASVLQEEIKSAPLFERIINKIIAIDLNETTTEVKRKIKASVVAVPPVIDETSETGDSATADSATDESLPINKTPDESTPENKSSLNTESQDI